MNDNKKIVSVVVYARISTSNMGQDCLNQLIPCRNLAQSRDLIIKEEYIDEGYSGTKDSRPSLDRMMMDARNGKFNHIIIYSLDRISRSSRHMLNLINELNKYGVSIISIRESIDFSSPIGAATLTILSAIAQLEVSILRSRIKTALAAKKQYALENNTGWTCGRPKLMTDEKELQIIKLRSEGMSIRAIARSANVSKGSVERVLRQNKRLETSQ